MIGVTDCLALAILLSIAHALDYNAGLTLVYYLRRWPNIMSPLGQCILYARIV